jgi:hypothetical protein
MKALLTLISELEHIYIISDVSLALKHAWKGLDLDPRFFDPFQEHLAAGRARVLER